MHTYLHYRTTLLALLTTLLWLAPAALAARDQAARVLANLKLIHEAKQLLKENIDEAHCSCEFYNAALAENNQMQTQNLQ